MTLAFKPLDDKASLLSSYAKPYRQVLDQAADIITFTDLSPCPLCHDDQLVEYIQPHNNPEHGEYSVAISCRQCRIQTQPQHWFISEPTSATRALNAAIQNWQELSRQTIDASIKQQAAKP